MFAVVKSGGKQYRVAKDDTLIVEKLAGEIGDIIELGPVLMLGEEGKAWEGLSRTLDIANIGLSAELLGLSAEAFERTVAYLKERKQFGRVIGSFQGLQHRAAELFA